MFEFFILIYNAVELFFEKYFVGSKNVRTFAPDFASEIVQKELPHSSSGPGHLPLTQKIMSSTLICGTKASGKRRLFYLAFFNSLFFRIFAF